MNEKIEVERPICGLAYLRHLIAQHVHRKGRATERTQRSSVRHSGDQMRRGEPTHRGLDNRMSYAEQFGNIASGPHLTPPQR